MLNKRAIRRTLFECMACDDTKKFKMAARLCFKRLRRTPRRILMRVVRSNPVKTLSIHSKLREIYVLPRRLQHNHPLPITWAAWSRWAEPLAALFPYRLAVENQVCLARIREQSKSWRIGAQFSASL